MKEGDFTRKITNNAIAFSAPIAVFVSVFLIYRLGQSGWFKKCKRCITFYLSNLCTYK